MTVSANDAIPTPKANKKRKKCYQFFFHALHGVLGRGVRVQLPQCVVKHVRNEFLEDNENTYMGFRED